MNERIEREPPKDNGDANGKPPKDNTACGNIADDTSNIRPGQQCCALCGKKEAHTYCTLCYHYFHDNPKVVPAGEES